jgi:hypothetical protein
MPESEPEGLSQDGSFELAWAINRFEALNPESLARVVADAAARIRDETLDDHTRTIYGSIWLTLRNLQLGASPAEVHQKLVEFMAMLDGDGSPG